MEGGREDVLARTDGREERRGGGSDAGAEKGEEGDGGERRGEDVVMHNKSMIASSSRRLKALPKSKAPS